MPQAKKFGAFAGVFTPSILTILGVIMYLRLPSIVGQAGLIQTALIIGVAHIISITTGLSVSSIATDKKVRAGGTYFMISRSLGLPIGGTLGLALFVGLAFSVSLYLIGFSESFLGYWGLPAGKNAIRIAGSITLIFVTVVTLISTALALRAQFYIMAAIALSLLSILLGSHDLASVPAGLHGLPTAAPFIVLFGIFFPAVTGFEAGVSMSGDLRDPKRAIPVATIAAIGVGFLVYLALAAFLAFTVSAEQLAGNPNVLLDISLFAPLVVAGIWGATISSAFGSILGAPRILQATAVDGITPRWFSVGYGRENEPRHALLLAFIIAEAGILIGELDVIARIVSMFFITTYGFLNLTAAIESRVSPDFRPDFRVPWWIGLIGSAACFIVMIQLDFVAMVGATILLGGLYVYLTRKQLKLDTGDTWEGVWSSMARTALTRLDRGETHRRNWRPNIVLFGGAPDARPHLIEFGRQLSDKRGVLTNFEIVERDGDSPPGRARPTAPIENGREDDPASGVFGRRVECADVYAGMEQIARHYGMAGLEPNTVLMGWARNAARPRRFTTLLESLAELDLNVLLLDHDRARGYGAHESIDVWWRLTGNDVTFGLNLVRFLTTSDLWRAARVRFLTVNDADSAFALPIRRDMARALEEFRVDADVRIINNAVERRSFVDIVRAESLATDLTVIGMADLRRGDAARLITDTNALVDELGTVVLVHASSSFRQPLVESAILADPAMGRPDGGAGHDGLAEAATLPPRLDAREGPLATLLAGLDAELQLAVDTVFDDYHGRVWDVERNTIREIGALAGGALADFAQSGDQTDAAGIAHRRAAFTARAIARIEAAADAIEAQRALLIGAGEWLPGRVAELASGLPATVTVHPPADACTVAPGDSVGARVAKTTRRAVAWIRRRPPSYVVRLRELAAVRLDAFASAAVDDGLRAFAAGSHRAAGAAERLLGAALDGFDSAARAARGLEPMTEVAALEAEALRSDTDDAGRALADAAQRARDAARADGRLAINELATLADRIDASAALRDARRTWRSGVLAPVRDEAVTAWTDARTRVRNQTMLTLRLAALAHDMDGIAADTRRMVSLELEQELAARIRELRRSLDDAGTRSDGAAGLEFSRAAALEPPLQPEALVERVRLATRQAAAPIPVAVEGVAEDTVDALASGRVEDVVAASIPARQVVDYLAEAELLGPLLGDINAAGPRLAQVVEVTREVAQLATFHLAAPGNGETDASDAAASVVRTGVERLDRALETLHAAAAELDDAIRRRFEALIGRLELHTVHRLAEKLPQYLRSQRGRRVMGGLVRIRRDASRLFVDQVVGLVYRRSEGMLLAGKIQRGARAAPLAGQRLAGFAERVSPAPSVLEKLPHYYRQLFLGRPAATGDLEIGFQRELAEADVAIDLHRRGHEGALLALGEQGQGRSTLCGLIAQRRATPDAIYRIDPPRGGSIDTDAFVRRLGAVSRNPGPSPGRILDAFPPGSVLIINDLELWWERSPEGGAVLDLLDELIARAGPRLLILLNASPRAFALANRIRPMEERILRTIECEPFSARQLQEVVLLRHASTGLTFSLDGKTEEELSRLRLARLFDAHYDYSDGNIGVTLHAWISHIREIDGDLLRISAPRRPGLDVFEPLEPLQLMLLVQFVLHGALTAERLARITRLDGATLARETRSLVRAGLLVEDPRGDVSIDRFVYPHLVRFLARRELV